MTVVREIQLNVKMLLLSLLVLYVIKEVSKYDSGGLFLHMTLATCQNDKPAHMQPERQKTGPLLSSVQQSDDAVQREVIKAAKTWYHVSASVKKMCLLMCWFVCLQL